MHNSKRHKGSRYEAAFSQAVTDKLLDPDMEDVDSDLDYGPLNPSTSRLYDDELVAWEAYQKERGATQDPRDVKVLKHFIKALALSMVGRQSENNPERRPTVDSVRSRARRFMSSWNRKHPDKSPIPKDLRDRMCPYIQGTLARNIGLISGGRAKRDKKFLTSDIFIQVLIFTWHKDWHCYLHEAVRIDNTLILLMHCYTSGRRAEICQAIYRDFECQVGYFNGKLDIKVKFRRRICKGKNVEQGTDIDQPEHIVSERWDVADEDYPSLLAQPIVHLLANFLSAGAFREFSTLSEILAAKPLQGHKFRVLEFREDILDQPVFPVWSATGKGSSSRTPPAFGYDLDQLAKRSGLTDGIKTHDSRRKALFNADNAGYSVVTTLQFASQKNPGVLQGSYLGRISAVDGAATYLGLPPRKDLQEDFHSATMKYNPGLVQSLLSEDIEQIESSDAYAKYTKDIQDLQGKISCASETQYVSALKANLAAAYRLRHGIFKAKLRDKQKKQKLDYDAKEPYNEKDYCQGHLQRFLHMLPRARQELMKIMMLSAPPRAKLWKQAIEYLIELRNAADCSVAYQECFQPNETVCPVENCAFLLERLPNEDRWSHVYSCAQMTLAERTGYASFCFSCSAWFLTRPDWEDHCGAHISQGRVDFRYDPITIRHATATAGHCPVCIWCSGDMPASKKFHQFPRKDLWKKHVFSCIHNFIRERSNQGTLICPDQRCPFKFDSAKNLWHHLSDVHSIPTPEKEVLAKLEAKRRIVLPQQYFEARFVEAYPDTPTYPDLGDASSVDDSSEDLSQENTASVFTASRSRSQTPLSDLDSEIPDEIRRCSSLGDDTPTPLAVGAAGQELLMDPMLSVDNKQACKLPSSSECLIPPLDEPSILGRPFHANDSPMPLAEETCSHDDNEPPTLPDGYFEVDRLLGKWKYGRTFRYYVRWATGQHSLEPEGNITDDIVKEFSRQEFTGFQEGCNIIKRVKSKDDEAWYLVAFEGCDKTWTLPDSALHPTMIRPKPALVRPAKPDAQRKTNSRKRKRRS